MGVAGVGIAIFMALSLTISWLSGDKARGSLEEKLTEEETVQTRLEKDLKDARVKAASDAQLLRDIENKLNAQILENKRLERAIDIEEAQKRIAEQEGQAACAEKACPDQKAFSQVQEKNKQDTAILETKLKAAMDAKMQAEQNVKELETFRTGYEKLSQQYTEATKEKQDALLTIGMLQAKIKERSEGQASSSQVQEKNTATLETKLKAATDAKMQAEQNVKELETFRTGYEKLSQQYAEATREKQDALLTIGMLQATIKERSKGQVSSLESRLMSLEQNKMGLQGQLSSAMAAIVQLDETAARLESGLGSSAQPVEGMLKLQAEIESLRQARENVRLAMENVKGSMQSNMDTETIRMKSEINQLSGSLEQIASINKGAGSISLMGQTGLQEEPMDLKGGEDTTVLNKKLQGLNLTIEDVFQEAPQQVQTQTTVPVGQSALVGLTEGAPCADVRGAEQAPVARADTAPQEYYTVVKGDSLWKIAAKKKIYSNPYLWPILYKYNLETVYHPDAIKPGYVLSIMRNLTNPEQELAIKKAQKHTNDRAKKGYILRLRRELTEGALTK